MMYSCRVDLVGYSVLATAWCTGIHDGSATGNKIVCHTTEHLKIMGIY